jgi:4-oxalomesaconate hydratase
MLVVSAHAADFVWRAGGAIALYASRGWRVRILCLSYGERGESEKLWKQPGMTLDVVKHARHDESEKAALFWAPKSLLRHGRLSAASNRRTHDRAR